MPELGLDAASHGQPLSAPEIGRLRDLRLGHLRADLELAQPDYPARLRRAMGDADALGVPLHLALHIAVEDGPAQVSALADLVAELKPPGGGMACLPGSRALLGRIAGASGVGAGARRAGWSGAGRSLRRRNRCRLHLHLDVRQMSLFGAGWTVCSLRSLAATGVAAITYYETTGWHGVMKTAGGSPLPELFHSFAGGVFPLYHVFADVADFAGGDVLALSGDQPLAVDGLALRKDGRIRILVANMTAGAQTAVMRGLPRQVSTRLLDATNVVAAMQTTAAFRAQPGRIQETTAGRLALTLPPYAVARLDG